MVFRVCYNLSCSSAESKEVQECQENVKFAEKDRFPETMYLIQIDTPEESGMLIFRL